jgi:hypothetical protein
LRLCGPWRLCVKQAVAPNHKLDLHRTSPYDFRRAQWSKLLLAFFFNATPPNDFNI